MIEWTSGPSPGRRRIIFGRQLDSSEPNYEPSGRPLEKQGDELSALYEDLSSD